MAGLARGKIIYGNASGDPTALTVGSSGQALVSDGTDISWGAAGASLSGSTNNTVATVTGANALAGEANLTFDGSTLAVTGTITASTAVNPSANDAVPLGTTSLGYTDLFIADGGQIQLGNDQDIKITHVADTGLTFKNTNTGAAKPMVLNFQTAENDIAANDVLGKITFAAVNETTGTDANLISATIVAASEGDFSSSSNASRLEFHTASSETADHLNNSRMSLNSSGYLGIHPGGHVTTHAQHHPLTLTVDNDGLFINNYPGTNGEFAKIMFGAHGVASPRAKQAIVVKKSHDYGAGDMQFWVDSNADDAEVDEADAKLTITKDGLGLSQFTALAWCNANFNDSTPDIRDSHNVSSIEYFGSTGYFGFHWDVDTADGDYAAVMNCYVATSVNTGYTDAAFATNSSYMRFQFRRNSALYNPAQGHVVVFGD